MIELYIGRRATGVWIERDAVYPAMWRIGRCGIELSDMVNLSRAKEGGLSWARPRGLGGQETISWKWHHREKRLGVRQSKNNGVSATHVAAGDKNASVDAT